MILQLVGIKLLNHLCYADDMCLISISSSGMQQLLNACLFYIEHSLLHMYKQYNGTKWLVILTAFKPISIKIDSPCFYLGELHIPKVTLCKYLDVIIWS